MYIKDKVKVMQMKMKKGKIIIAIFLVIAISLIIPKKSMAFLWFKDPIYREPNIITREDKSGLDDMIEDAEAFEKEKGAEVGGSGSQTIEIPQDKIQNFSNDLFSILIIAATALSIIVGVIIGIKYMMGSVEEKAKYKELLIPYLAGCASVYGALGIWQLLVKILGSV